MAERTDSRDERTLADRLRREAIESRPDFSARLHARVCRALGQLRSEAVGSGAQVHSLRSRWPHGWHARAAGWKWVAVATAACLAGAAIVAWQATRATRRPELARVDLNPAPISSGERGPALGPAGPGVGLYALGDLTDRVSGSIGDWVDSTVAIQQWAYLDHDARLTVEMLADRLPFDVAAAPVPQGSR